MEIKKQYTIELTWEELRDVSNALHDALYSRTKHGDYGIYPVNKYRELQDKINKAL